MWTGEHVFVAGALNGFRRRGGGGGKQWLQYWTSWWLMNRMAAWKTELSRPLKGSVEWLWFESSHRRLNRTLHSRQMSVEKISVGAAASTLLPLSLPSSLTTQQEEEEEEEEEGTSAPPLSLSLSLALYPYLPPPLSRPSGILLPSTPWHFSVGRRRRWPIRWVRLMRMQRDRRKSRAGINCHWRMAPQTHVESGARGGVGGGGGEGVASCLNTGNYCSKNLERIVQESLNGLKESLNEP